VLVQPAPGWLLQRGHRSDPRCLSAVHTPILKPGSID
jgi:hypothetical protein